MATQQSSKKMDPKFKWLIGLGIVLVVILVVLKSPMSEKFGIKLQGVDSDASYGSPATSACTGTACLDSRIQITSPASEYRIGPRKTHKIGWTEDQSIEARWHQISIHAIGCGSNCPAPFVIVDKYKGRSPYSWQIGSFLTNPQGVAVPQELQNVPVWLRVSTQGKFDANGQPKDYYNQIPVVISNFR